MTRPVNNSPCRFYTGAARQKCQKMENQQPVVGKPQRTKVTDKQWEKFIKCGDDQVVHQLMVTRFHRAITQLKKTSQNVAKSNGTLAGAIVFLAGAIGAVMDAAAMVSTHERLSFRLAIQRARYTRYKHQPLARWKVFGGSKFIVVDPWQINSVAESVCRKKQDTDTCVKKFKARTWKEIRKKAGKHPIVTIKIAPRNIVKITKAK